jgi:hypothetical protein
MNKKADIRFSYLKREKKFLIISLSLIFLLAVILKMLPVKKIAIPLTDSAYLNCIQYDNRISRQFPSIQNAGYAIFKRLKLVLPFRISGEMPGFQIYARTTGNHLNYQLIINKRYAGVFHVTSHHFLLLRPKIEKTLRFNDEDLRVLLNYEKQAQQTPRFFLKQIAISAEHSDTSIKRDLYYILCVFLMPLLFVIISSLWLQNAAVKYIISLAIVGGFFLIGTFSIPLTLALCTVIFPIALIGILLALLMLFLNARKIISIEKNQIAISLFIFYIGMTLWMMLVFHPGHYHPDLKTHIYWGLSAYEQSAGDFAAEYSFFQMNTLFLINAPFPYSPSFYIALKLLSNEPADILFWVRFLPVFLTILVAPVLYLTVRKISGSSVAGIWASIAYIISGITTLRILYFFCPALWGTFFITAAMLVFCLRSESYGRDKPLIDFLPEILLIFFGCIAYPAGPFALGIFAVGLFFLWLAMSVERRVLIKNWLHIFTPSIGMALLLYYVWYIPEIVLKVLPKMKDKVLYTVNLEVDHSIWSRFQGLLGVNAIIILGLIGYTMLLIKIRSRILRTVLICWGVSWLALFAARFIPVAKTLFKFSKDELFLLPLLSISLGYLVHWLWAGKKYQKALAVVVILTLIAGFFLKLYILIPRLYVF